MLGFYLFAAVLGGGLLLLSMLGGGEHDTSHDVGGHDFDHDVGHDVNGGHDGHGGHDAGADHDAHFRAGELVLGLFRPRNMIFFLATFGITGTLLTLLTSVSTFGGLVPSLAMGFGAMVVTHGVFVWLKRSETAVDVVSDAELEGSLARVTLPLTPGARGRIACSVGGREVHVVARLAAGYEQTLDAGREVVVLHMSDTVAEVMPFESRDLPPGES
jgi:hypothetical protein